MVIDLCGKHWVFLKRKDRKKEQALIENKKEACYTNNENVMTFSSGHT